MSDASKQRGWSRPAAMAVPRGGFFKDKVEQGRYGPIFPKTPACYGFSILAKVIPGREERFYEYAPGAPPPEKNIGRISQRLAHFLQELWAEVGDGIRR